MREVRGAVWLIAMALLLGPAEVGYAQEEPAQASAQEDEEPTFNALARSGAEAYGGQDYARAVELFEQAYALRADPRMLYNIGRALEKAGEFERAIDYFERFAAEPDVKLEARRDAIERAETLARVVERREARRARAAEETRAPGGEEGGAAGAVVDEEGAQRADAASGGDEASVGEPAAKLREERGGARGSRVLAYSLTGVGLASLGVAGWAALATRDAHEDFEQASTRAALEEASGRGQTRAIVADSALGVGVVLTGIGVFLWLSEPGVEDQGDAARMRLGPRLGAGEAGVSFTLDF